MAPDKNKAYLATGPLAVSSTAKNGAVWFYNAVLHPEGADGKANNVDSTDLDWTVHFCFYGE